MATGSPPAQPRWAIDILRWVVLGTISGVMAGISSLVFLAGLDLVTLWREEGRQWLVFLLPFAGLAVGLVYHLFGGRSAEGSGLLLEQIHEPTAWVPRRMAPLVLVGTWVSHLFGASVGREGTALQMSGSLSDGFARVIRMPAPDRRIMLVTAISAGFGAVFGVPLAGAVFGLEVQALGRSRWTAIVPALTASFVGDRVLRTLGGHHVTFDQLRPDVTPAVLVKLLAAGVLFGAAGAAYPLVTHAIQRLMDRRVAWPPMRPFVGGCATIVLVLLFGHDYQGLSLPLIGSALQGVQLGFAVFALKLVFTAVAVGTGFFGGEVTPLFVIGATLGSALAVPFGVDGQLIAAVGFCAVFAAAANTPLACIVLGAELFGTATIVPIAVGCIMAYVVSGHHGIYRTHRTHSAKFANTARRNRNRSSRVDPVS